MRAGGVELACQWYKIASGLRDRLLVHYYVLGGKTDYGAPVKAQKHLTQGGSGLRISTKYPVGDVHSYKK